MVPPGLRRPSLSAASIMARATRSLALPPGFMASTLASRGSRSPLLREYSRRATSGVCPMSAVTSLAIFIMFHLLFLFGFRQFHISFRL